MPHESLIQLTLDITGGKETSPEELLDLATNLRTELSETSVESIEPVRKSGNTPLYTKGMDAATAQLLVTLGVAAVPNLVLLIQNFMLRQKDQMLKIKIKDIELEVPRNAKPEEIQKLVKMIEKLAAKKK